MRVVGLVCRNSQPVFRERLRCGLNLLNPATFTAIVGVSEMHHLRHRLAEFALFIGALNYLGHTDSFLVLRFTKELKTGDKYAYRRVRE